MPPKISASAIPHFLGWNYGGGFDVRGYAVDPKREGREVRAERARRDAVFPPETYDEFLRHLAWHFGRRDSAPKLRRDDLWLTDMAARSPAERAEDAVRMALEGRFHDFPPCCVREAILDSVLRGPLAAQFVRGWVMDPARPEWRNKWVPCEHHVKYPREGWILLPP